jgi:spore coat polysaccharide biosynthesis protein SpsF (cytidylyltransferase family)
MICSAALAKIDAERLSPDEQEHVTKHFYSHSDQFAILNFQSVTDLSGQSFAVDTSEDLARLEKIVQAGGALPRFEVKA